VTAVARAVDTAAATGPRRLPGGGDRGGFRGGDRERGGYQGGYRGGDRDRGGDQGGYRGDRDRGGYAGGDRGGSRGGDRPQGGGFRGDRDRGGYQGGADRVVPTGVASGATVRRAAASAAIEIAVVTRAAPIEDPTVAVTGAMTVGARIEAASVAGPRARRLPGRISR
jgi:hypothetical protein